MTTTTRIDARASDWAIRLQSGELTEAERAELKQWLEMDTRHRGALLRAQAAWEDLDRLAALAAGTDLGGAPPSWRYGAASSPGKNRPARAWARVVRTVSFRVATAAVVIIALGCMLIVQFRSESYSTPSGRTESVRLSDGSQVTLNADTRIHVRLARTERRIELDRGEALFRVAKDPARPFVVQTGTITIRAIGTTFAVRKEAHLTDVMVTEGIVELVDHNIAASPVLRRLVANERATVMDTRHVSVQKLAPGASQRQLAWVDGLVSFTGESLATAVDQMNRHNRLRIVVDDPALAARPIAGSFKLNDPENFAATVAVALGAEHVREDDAIHLRMRRQP